MIYPSRMEEITPSAIREGLFTNFVGSTVFQDNS